MTSFFRDDAAWEYLAAEILPRIVADKGGPEGKDPIRVWSAGCASGEEVYSVAMLLAEQIGPEQFRTRTKIYATDVSDGALNRARQGSYSPQEVESVPKPLLGKYFKENGNSYTFDPELRRCVVFGRHDLVQDSPISKIDLLACRNTLMYFNAESQSRILSRFSFALTPGGFLFLGKAEMLFTNSQVFRPVDLRRRVFMRTATSEANGRVPPGPYGAGNGREERALPVDGVLVEAALQHGPAAMVVFNNDGVLVRLNDQARTLFTLSGRDIGRALGELTLSYRPLEIRTVIERANAERRSIHIRDVEWPVPGSVTRFFDVSVSPLYEPKGQTMGNLLTYSDATDRRRLRDELSQCQQDRETANEELQTTNEELQSTVEELETTNEELQSTNEELETMNEELQSTNEELRTSNEELRLRSDDLDRLSGFWNAVLGSLNSALVVLDPDMRVEVWSAKAEDMWGVRSAEVMGKHFLNLDIGLPVEKLRAPIKACLADGQEPTTLTVDSRNRRGRTITCRVICSPKIVEDHAPGGAVLLIEEVADGKEEPA